MATKPFKTAAVAATLATLALPAAAFAQRPALNLDRAQSRAESYATQTMQGDNEATRRETSPSAKERLNMIDAGFDPADFEPGPIVTGIDVECDLETRFRAVCGIEYALEGGGVREQEIEVLVTRKGALRIA
jgi:hypothetical protein